MASQNDSFEFPSLKNLIDDWSAENANDFPPEVVRIFSEKTQEVLKSQILNTCIGEGDLVQDFVLSNLNGERVQLSERLAEGPVILSFYRGSWCPYCTLEFQALLQSIRHFKQKGASVLAISPQISNRFESPGAVGFEDLCDESNQVARDFGLVFPLGDEIRNVYNGFGIRLEDLNGDNSYEVPVPATYIISRDSLVHYAHASADFSQRAEPETLLHSLAELN